MTRRVVVQRSSTLLSEQRKAMRSSKCHAAATEAMRMRTHCADRAARAKLSVATLARRAGVSMRSRGLQRNSTGQGSPPTATRLGWELEGKWPVQWELGPAPPRATGLSKTKK